MNIKVICSSLLLLSLLTSCGSDDDEVVKEEVDTSVVDPEKETPAPVGKGDSTGERLIGTWQMTKLINKSNQDVTTSCNLMDTLVANSGADDEFDVVETRHRITGAGVDKTCDAYEVSNFKFVIELIRGKEFLYFKNGDKKLGTYRFIGDALELTFIERQVDKTVVTYAKK